MRILVRCLLFVSLVLAALNSVSSAEEPAPLRLVGSVDGQEFDQFTAEKGELLVRTADGTTSPVPRGTRWRLEGDLHAHARECFLAPTYRIATRTAYPFTMETPARTFAWVQLRRGWPWSDRELDGGLAVFVWLVDGGAVRVAPVVARARNGPSGEVAALAGFELDEISARGAPVVLFLKENRFIEPKSWFPDDAARRVLVNLHLGSDAQLDAAVADLPEGDVRCVRDGRSLLHFVAAHGRAKAIPSLLARGTKSGVRDEQGGTALHEAAMFGRIEVARALLAAGATNGPIDRDRRSAFDRAMLNGHFAVAGELLDPRPRLDLLKVPLEDAIGRVDVALIDLLLLRGASRHVRAMSADVFANAVMAGDGALLQRLLALKLKADAAPVVLAATLGRRLPMVDALLVAGAKPDRTAHDGTSALMIAAWNGDLPIVDALLRAGANVNRANERGETAVFLARVAGHKEVADTLEARGATTPADPAREEARRRRPDPFESYLPHPAGPVFAESEVDRPPVLRNAAAPEILRNIQVEIRQFTTTKSLDPVTGNETQFRNVTPDYGNLSLSGDTDHWALMTLIVEPNGAPSFVQVVAAASLPFAEAIKKAARRYVFAPGEHQGRRVRTRVTLAITVDP